MRCTLYMVNMAEMTDRHMGEFGSHAKRGPGRPRAEHPLQQIAVRLPQDMLSEIDRVVADRLGQTDRAAVIREAIARGLREMR